MFTFGLPLFALLLLTTITTAQPYKATEHFLVNCGSNAPFATPSNQIWIGDEGSKFVPSNLFTTSFSSTPTSQHSLASEKHYNTARIFNTCSFTYTFPVSQGPKFLRLYFNPANYSDLNANRSFFSVSSNGYSLLTNFSASLTASLLSEKGSRFFKEFIIYVNNSRILDVTFTPSPNSHAFINGIEIVSLPEHLYYTAKNLNHVARNSGLSIDNYMALENIYRLNMGGAQLSGTDDTGMFRSWDADDNYLYLEAGRTPVTTAPITYTSETPNYAAPELVYQTQRSMGNMSTLYNLTWRLPVDSEFYYMLRLHFCNIIPQYTNQSQVIFRIFINNQTVEDEADLFRWTPQGTGYPVFKDYIVYVNDIDGQRARQDLWLAMDPNLQVSEGYADGMLNGLEVFKLSMNGNLASPNLQLISTTPPARLMSPAKRNKKKKPPYAMIIGGVGGGLLLVSSLLIIGLLKPRRVKHHEDIAGNRSPSSIELKSRECCHSPSPSSHCRRFTLRELKAATSNFNEHYIIGKGGFGNVYKGYIDKATRTVAIKRLDPSSKQGLNEFQTEIAMLSKLRHVHLVSLIGFCDDDGEMALVYDYMAHGTLQEHLYKTTNPPLSWKTRLSICIGAAQGLLYLHTAAKRGIIHRDVKSTNILLDENWVAKVSDFGLSKLGPKNPSQTHVSTLVKGSIGYLDPEYYRRQQLTEKSDVYSFGVVLFEVLCARPVIIHSLPSEQMIEMNLAEWGKHCHQKGTLDEIMDPKLIGEIAPASLRKFGEVAYRCLKEVGSERPAMDDVVCGLEFALLLQEAAAEEKVDEAMSEIQELPVLMNEELIEHSG